MNRNEQIERARQAMLTAQFDAAIEIYDQLLANRPDDAEVFYFKAQALANQGDLGAAVEVYDRALAVVQDPGNRADVLISKGAALLEQDLLDEAEACFDQALAVKPRLSTLFVEKARIAFRRQRFAESLQHCESALKLDDADARAWNNRAHALIKLGRFDEAIESELRALKIWPDYTAAKIGLHLAQEAKGETSKAEKTLAGVQESLRKNVVVESRGHRPLPPPPREKHWWQVWR